MFVEDRSVLSREGRLPDLALPEADIYFGDPSRPLVMLIHGGFWRPEYDRIHLRPMAAALSDLGWPVYSIEYRRDPGNPRATVEDVRAALAAVNRDVIVVGHSAGGHLALLMNSTRTIALAPVADLTLARELDLDDGAVHAFLGVHNLEDFQPAADRAVIIHGTDDEVVPISVTAAYLALHPSSRFVRLTGEGHFALIDPLSKAWPNVIDELDRLLA
ncbi:MAG TPA: alpha/beta hydrolase [Micromonosporaceae bacterium]|nr:alpha/beta hydrolase [Micromonosporaceae bacterium]